MNWRDTILGEFISMKRGYDLPEDRRTAGRVPIIGSAGITGYHNEAKVFGGGVTIGRSGNSFGKIYYCKEDFWPHNAAMYINDTKGNDERFIYYFLKNLDFSNYNSGSAQPSLNRNFIYPIRIRVPSPAIQQKIASILSAYDDLIENNLKRIKLLEEAAQNIYKEWFVNFRINGEQLEVNKETGLPEGWTKRSLYDIAEVQMGFPFKGEEFNEGGDGSPVIRIRDIPSQWTNTFSTQQVAENYIVERGDILIGMDGFFYTDVWCGQRGYLVQRVCRLRAYDTTQQGFLLEAIKGPIKYFEKTITGATVAHLGAKHLKQIEIVIPQTELNDIYGIFNSMMKQKLNLFNQVQLLKEGRDLLLPRLMNGSIEV